VLDGGPGPPWIGVIRRSSLLYRPDRLSILSVQ